MTTDTEAKAPQPPKLGAGALLFSFDGRVGRLQFWLVHLAAALMVGLFWAIIYVRPPGEEPMGGMAATLSQGLLVFVAALAAWPVAAISVKRCHDRGRSGWWAWLSLVPLLGQVWHVVNLGILRGQPGPNRFGDNADGAAQATQDVRSVSVMFFLGFAAGLPNLLIFDTLSAWLRDAGLSLEVIGFFSLATLAYSLKFVWAPLVDRTSIPLLTRLFGHRRSWMLVMQALVIVGLWLIAGTDPTTDLARMAVLAVLVGFTAATQDIVIDAWRIEAADVSRQGAMAAAYQWGYRLAMIVAGAVPLILAETYGWNLSYGVMAGLMGFGVAAVLLAPREKAHSVRPIPVGDLPSRPAIEVVEWLARLALIAFAALIVGSGLTGKPDLLVQLLGSPAALEPLTQVWTAKETGVFVQFAAVALGLMLLVCACWPMPGLRTRPGAYLAGSFGAPLMDFLRRFAGVAGLILALICLYRVSDFVLNIMNPFYLDLGFTKTEIAEVRKVFGVIASVTGVFLGGLAIARIGLMRSLLIGAFAGPLSNLVFAWLATKGADLPGLFVAIGVDNIASGFAGTCLIAYMSSLTSAGFTATQYALFSSLYALPGKLIASQSGRIVEGAARSADGGGIFAGLKSLFTALPEGALAEGAVKTGVTPAALGAGYVTFFFYSTLIGAVAIVLAFLVAWRQPKALAAVAAAEGQVKQTT